MYSVSGKVFHVDFGYILGRDPKPMPPPMKLSKEMVEAMGGTGSEQFTGMIQYFKQSPVLEITIARSPEATCFRTGLPTLRGR